MFAGSIKAHSLRSPVLAPAIGVAKLAAAGWAALAVAGHAAYVQLLHPGMWNFGFRSYDQIVAESPLALVTVFVQGVIVAWALQGQMVRLAHQLGIGRLAALVTVWTLGTTLLARSPDVYAASLLLTAWVHLTTLGNLVLIAQALPARWMQWVHAVFSGADQTPLVHRVIPWGAALFAVVASGLIATTVFQRVPHVPDEVAYVLQARMYAAGMVHVPAPPVPEAFDLFLMATRDGNWFSIFPPGWPLVLSLGALVGLPWLVNPLLAGLTVLLTHALVRDLFSRGAAHLAALLLALSPVFLFVSASHMSHTFSIACALTTLLGIHRARTQGPIWAGLAGLATGWLFLTRPVEGVIIGGVAGVWALGIMGERLPWTKTALFVATALLGVAAFLANNVVLTGQPLRDPIQVYFDQKYYPGCNTLGFGPDKGNFGWPNDIWQGHSPMEAALYANINANLVDLEMIGGGLGSWLWLGLFLLWGRKSGPVTILLAIAFATIAVTSLYWYGGADLGPRYWYQCLVPMIVLTALSAPVVADRLGINPGRVVALLLLASVAGTLSTVPWRAMNKYRNYRAVTGALGDLADTDKFARGLVIIRGQRHGDYAPLAVLNPLSFAGDRPIFAMADTPTARSQLAESFPDRPVYFVDGPSKTGEGYKLIAGPVSIETLKTNAGEDR